MIRCISRACTRNTKAAAQASSLGAQRQTWLGELLEGLEIAFPKLLGPLDKLGLGLLLGAMAYLLFSSTLIGARYYVTVDELLGDPGLAREMGRRGRDRQRTEFALEPTIARFEALYRQLYARRAG